MTVGSRCRPYATEMVAVDVAEHLPLPSVLVARAGLPRRISRPPGALDQKRTGAR
jgi:hypothetical protein